jgi:UDP-N-acetylglucosamine acyltransferase
VLVHPSAVVAPEAELEPGVAVGPYAVIDGRVRVGAGTRIGAHAVLEGESAIGRDCQIHAHAVVGTAPQDLKYRGEPTRLTLGDRCVIREFASVNRGTVGGGGHTVLGNGVVVMASAHVAHDCLLQDGVILANQVTLAGHVVLEAHAIVGGMTGIHQFCRVGRHAFVGACSAVLQDVAPFIKVQGNRVKPFGLNTVGLRRHGFTPESLKALGRAYRLIFHAGLNTSQALERIPAEVPACPEVDYLVEFIKRSQRGISK